MAVGETTHCSGASGSAVASSADKILSIFDTEADADPIVTWKTFKEPANFLLQLSLK